LDGGGGNRRLARSANIVTFDPESDKIMAAGRKNFARRCSPEKGPNWIVLWHDSGENGLLAARPKLAPIALPAHSDLGEIPQCVARLPLADD
jgi:hypothetical protein